MSKVKDPKSPTKAALAAHGLAPKAPGKPVKAATYDTFREWFTANLPEGTTRTDFAKALAAKSGGAVSASTIMNTLKGQRLTGYAKGKAIADLTNGAVALERIVE